jgi:hypothetical protein
VLRHNCWVECWVSGGCLLDAVGKSERPDAGQERPDPSSARQTVEVTPAPTTAGVSVGFTGAYVSEIGAFFGGLPPTSSAVPICAPITYYDVAVAITTDLTLPG